MATISLSSELDVLSKYECIMNASLGSESVYIRTKETLASLIEDGTMSGKEKAEIISTVLSNLTNTLVSSGLSTALQWAAQEKDTAFRKLELAKQLDILDQQKALQEAQVDKTKHESIATQANTIRMLGTPTVLNGQVQALAPTGKVWQDIKIGEQQEINLQKEAVLTDSRVKESQAGAHKVIADTIANYGPWRYTISADGIVSPPVRTSVSVTPLSDIQAKVAIEQAKGYAYNSWANGVTASAGMLGTAIASDGAISEIGPLLTIFQNGLNKLVNVPAPTFA